MSHFFINDPEYIEANNRIQNLIKAVLIVSKIKFKPTFFMKSVNYIDVKTPKEQIKKHFSVYLPTIRETEQGRIRLLQQEATQDSSKFMEELYTSSLNFWSDMVEIAKLVDHNRDKEFKKKWIKDKLKIMNKGLPSFVFIPSSSKNSKM